MCKVNHPQVSLTKPNLIQRLGGDIQLQHLLMEFVEHIIEDTDLHIVSKQVSTKRLTSLMKSLILAAFESNVIDEGVQNSAVMKNYTLLEMGVNASHLEKMKAHLETALRNCWVEEELAEECSLCFGSLKTNLQNKGNDLDLSRRTALPSFRAHHKKFISPYKGHHS